MHDEIWNKLLKRGTIGTLTPWNRNTKLPKHEMVEKYRLLAKELYISSPLIVSGKPKNRDRKTMKTIKEFNSTLREFRFQYGVISSRLRAATSNGLLI